MSHAEHSHSGKQVRAVLEIGVNYLFHLLAVARVGFDSEYADSYRGSVRSRDIVFLHEHKSALMFGAGQGGGEFLDIFMLPAAFGLQTGDEFARYYKLLLAGCDRKDFSAFMKEYDAPIRKLNQWAGRMDIETMRGYAAYADVMTRLRDITVENHDSYISEVWPKEKPKLERVAVAINEIYDNHDRIGQWEKLTGLIFKFDMYHILLCSAIKNGPDANSLGYDRVVFYHDNPIEKIIDFISHEIGTHIFMDDIKAVAAKNVFEWSDFYEGFECLAMYYNTLVLDKSDLNYTLRDYHTDEYMTIYADLRRKNPDITVREMLEQGVKRFLETHRT